jgi:hypothetical protein
MSLLGVRHAEDCAEGGGRCDCGALDRAITVATIVLRKLAGYSQGYDWWLASEIVHALDALEGTE